jgi:hypothetical protein
MVVGAKSMAGEVQHDEHQCQRTYDHEEDLDT